MSQFSNTPNGRNPELWDIAQRRASFKRNVLAYLVMSVFFWIIWYLSGQHTGPRGIPWPVWPMLGWGLGIVFQYIKAYVQTGDRTAENEYEKLINKK
jgi:cytochrome c oxidase assembly factor CtaG